MAKLIKTTEYKDFIQAVKSKIQSSQIKAAVRVNVEFLQLYWELGKDIVKKQQKTTWGEGFIEQVSNDLQEAFPAMKGFSTTNIKYMKNWYLFFSNSPQVVDESEKDKIRQQVTPQIFQIPWGHNREIITKCKTQEEALFYVNQTIANNWSRAVLVHQIESDLYHRKGKALSNFGTTLPAPQSDLAKQILKDPYVFDFLDLQTKHDERELETALIDHVAKLLLELGSGFSYIGRQYKIVVDGDEFSIDLLFYHVKLHCFVVVDLKTVKFVPEFAGKLNFYVTTIDEQIKSKQDNPTIGMLICKSKNNTVVEYAIKDINKPIGVSEYILTKKLPENLQSAFPTIEEIEAGLEKSKIS